MSSESCAGSTPCCCRRPDSADQHPGAEVGCDAGRPLVDRRPVAEVARRQGDLAGDPANESLGDTLGRSGRIPGPEEDLPAAGTDQRLELVELLRSGNLENVVAVVVDPVGPQRSGTEQPDWLGGQAGPVLLDE